MLLMSNNAVGVFAMHAILRAYFYERRYCFENVSNFPLFYKLHFAPRLLFQLLFFI